MCALAAITLCLTGCHGTPRGVSVPLGADKLVPCAAAHIPINELASMGDPGCDLTGSILTFADETMTLPLSAAVTGGAVTVPGVGAVFSQGDGRGHELLIVNWGIPGVGVAAIENGRLVKLWGSSDAALDLQRQQLAVEGISVD